MIMSEDIRSPTHIMNNFDDRMVNVSSKLYLVACIFMQYLRMLSWRAIRLVRIVLSCVLGLDNLLHICNKSLLDKNKNSFLILHSIILFFYMNL